MEPEAPDHEEGFVNDFSGHLGAALEAVGEDDGDFGDAKALTPEFVGHFDLEAVAIGPDGIEVEALERGPAKAFVAASRIADGHAGDEADVFARAHAEHETAQGPVDDADAVFVARAEDEVGILGGSEEGGDVVRVVGEVAVHFEDELVIAFEGPLEAGAVGAAEAVFFGAMEDVNAGVLFGDGVGNLARAIGRIVIDDEQLDVIGVAHDALDDGGKVILLVVGRDNDEGFLTHRRIKAGNEVGEW